MKFKVMAAVVVMQSVAYDAVAVVSYRLCCKAVSALVKLLWHCNE